MTAEAATATQHRRRTALLLLCDAALLLALQWATPARADTVSSSGPNRTPVSTNLKFAINIDKFVYLRLGDETTINTASFTLAPTIPAGGTTPTTGNNRPANWSGAAPGFSVTASGNALPVEVRSNGGTVTLRATTSTALTSGSATIPMSRITVSSSDGNLPAPPLADTGSGSSVTVTGTAFGNRVTERTATWTFTYAPTATQLPLAGTYSGQIQVTASVP